MRLVPAMAGLTSGLGMPASCRRCRTAFSFSERVGAAVARTARSCFAPRWLWVMRSRRVISLQVERLVDRAAQRLEVGDGGEVDDRLRGRRDRDALVGRGRRTCAARYVLMPSCRLIERRDHVGVAAGRARAAPQHRRREVRERRAGAARLDGREAPRLELEVRVGQGVNTPIKGEQAAPLATRFEIALVREPARVQIGRCRRPRAGAPRPAPRERSRVRVYRGLTVNARVACAKPRADPRYGSTRTRDKCVPTPGCGRPGRRRCRRARSRA